jgi:hypothetical protein
MYGGNANKTDTREVTIYYKYIIIDILLTDSLFLRIWEIPRGISARRLAILTEKFHDLLQCLPENSGIVP